MARKKLFFLTIDERYQGNVRFSDGSTIWYEGKGDILVIFKKNEDMVIPNVIYLPSLKPNLGNLDEEGNKTLLSGCFLTVHDKFGR